MDVIVADLDGGCINIPQHITLALMPEPMQSRVLQALYMVSVDGVDGSGLVHPDCVAVGDKICIEMIVTTSDWLLD